MDFHDDKITTKLKYTAKDSVFRALFSDPHYLLEMYRTLHPEDTNTTANDLELVTLEQVLFNGPYNDLGILAGDRLLILVEAQSTWSPNIVIRSLMYLMGTYQEYFDRRRTNLYGSRLVHMPKPELYAVYPDWQNSHPPILSLKDTYFKGQPCDIDARVHIIYRDNSSSIINQYIIFCTVLNEQVKLHGRTKLAIDETIRSCQNLNVLASFLESRRTEVEGLMFTLFSQEKLNEIMQIEAAENSKFDTLKQNVKSIMESLGITASEAIAILKLSPADSKRLAAMIG